MADVVKGMKIKNNDPRWKDRVVQVIDVIGHYAFYISGKRRVRIHMDHIHDDDKRRNTGWQVCS